MSSRYANERTGPSVCYWLTGFVACLWLLCLDAQGVFTATTRFGHANVTAATLLLIGGLIYTALRTLNAMANHWGW